MEQIFEIIMDENFPNECKPMFQDVQRVVATQMWEKKATSKYYHIYSNQKQKEKILKRARINGKQLLRETRKKLQ